MRDERATIQSRLDEANAALPQAKEQHVLMQAQQERGRASPPEVAEAGSAVGNMVSEIDHLFRRGSRS